MDSYKSRRDREQKQVIRNNTEIATVTSPGKEINAEGIGEYRQIPLIAPFGVRWNPPASENIQLIKNWDNGKAVVAVGTIVDKELPSGEVEIYSLGGATIRLKNDGTVIINNSVTISADGTISAKHFISTQYGGVYYG